MQTTPGAIKKMIDYAIRWRLALMAFGIVCLFIASPISSRLRTEQSVSSLFGDDDITLQEYRELKKWFGEDDVLVLMYRDEALPTPGGIERSRKLTERIKSIEGVNAALSPSVLNRAAEGISEVKLPFGFGSSAPKSRKPRLMQEDDPVGKGLSEIFAGYTHSEDYSFAAVVAMIDDQRSAETVAELREVASWWSQQQMVGDVSLVGEPVLVDEAFSLVRRDGARLAIVTVALLSLVVVFALFDFRLVVLLALVISYSVVVTKAIMYSAGIALSLIASILTAIVTVVAVTAVLHLGVRYHSRRGRGFSQFESTREVMHRMAAPIFWTCATDAAGFAALWFSEILPVRQFGLMVALAAINVFVGILFFTPTCLMLPEMIWLRRILPTRHLLTRTLRRLCFRVAAAFARKNVLTVVGAATLLIAAIVVVTGSETETSFLRNFRSDSAIVRDYGNVEKNLGGAGVWDLVLDVPDPLSNQFLAQVQELEIQLLKDLGGENGLSKAISIADATEVLGRSRAGNWMPASVRIAAMRTRLPTFIGALISDPIQAEGPEATTRRKLRIMLRSDEGLSAADKRRLIEGVNRIATEHLSRWESESESRATAKPNATAEPIVTAKPNATAEPIVTAKPNATAESAIEDRVTVTGYYVIMTRLVDQLVSDQWRCFIASAILIWLLMAVATKSFRLATAALVPNLMPAFLVLATVSLGGGRINMGAAMIAAVSVGLSIDGSVHLLTVYRRRRAIGRRPGQACVSAAGNIGAPVMLATLALVAGFSVLSTSEFIPTATFGTLVAWTLVIGTIINLSVLPALVRSFDR